MGNFYFLFYLFMCSLNLLLICINSVIRIGIFFLKEVNGLTVLMDERRGKKLKN